MGRLGSLTCVAAPTQTRSLGHRYARSACPCAHSDRLVRGVGVAHAHARCRSGARCERLTRDADPVAPELAIDYASRADVGEEATAGGGHKGRPYGFRGPLPVTRGRS
jgi:hypothetical protein